MTQSVNILFWLFSDTKKEMTACNCLSVFYVPITYVSGYSSSGCVLM